jgi:hypothetical protein
MGEMIESTDRLGVDGVNTMNDLPSTSVRVPASVGEALRAV